MERRALRFLQVIAWAALLNFLAGTATAATTSTNASTDAATGQGSAFDGGGDVENVTTTTLAPIPVGTNNHSYELRCWPRAQLRVDEAPAQVTRAFRAALRVLCVLARAAAQATLNASAPDWNPHSPGYRFGYLTTEDAYDASEYQSGSQAGKRFDIVFADGQPVNSSDVLAMFSYTCRYGPPGHQLELNDRTLRAGSVAWVLLGRLACRDWWEARAPPDSAENGERGGQEDSEERAISAFTRRLRFALDASLLARDQGQGQGQGARARERRSRRQRVARGLLDNRVDEFQPPSPTPHPYGEGFRNHSYDVSCALLQERLLADGVELQVSRHLQSLLRYLCALLYPHGHNDETGHGNVMNNLGYIVTGERFNPMDFAKDSPMDKKLDVEYWDGHRRHGRHVTPVHVRCAGTATTVSVRGQVLAPRSLAWALLAGMRCAPVAFRARALHVTHASHGAPRDDAKAWRLQQRRPPHQPHPSPTAAPPSAPPSAPPLDLSQTLPPLFNAPPFKRNHGPWRTSLVFATLASPTADSAAPSPLASASPSVSLHLPLFLDLPLPSPSSSSEHLFPAPSLSSTSPSSPTDIHIPSSSSFSVPSTTTFPPLSPLSSLPNNQRSYSPSSSPIPQTTPETSTPKVSVSEEGDPSFLASTSIPWWFLFPIPSTASSAQASPSVTQRIAPTRRHDERTSQADWRQDAAAHVMRDLNEDDTASEKVGGEGEESVIGNSGEVLPTPERLDSASPNNRVFSSEEYMDDGEDFHNHSYILRCAESGSLAVDGEEARLASHMAAALFFLCALLTSAQGSRPTAYDFGSIRTVEAFRTEDVAVNGDGDGSLDVLYEGGALPRTQDVNIFWQTCRPDPPGPEFSLDSGPLLPHSIVWSLFSKVRCGAEHDDTFPGAERYFGDDVASEDRASEEVLPSYSDRHNYIIRCNPGEEALVVDGLEVRLTKHMESALGLLCFSAGLHGHHNVTRK